MHRTHGAVRLTDWYQYGTSCPAARQLRARIFASSKEIAIVAADSPLLVHCVLYFLHVYVIGTSIYIHRPVERASYRTEGLG